MKTSLEHLPEIKRDELNLITRIICELAEPQMIILFGSYARGDYKDRIQIFQLHGGFSSDMTFVTKIDDRGLSGPMAVACASDATSQILYVADTGKNRVVKLNVRISSPGQSPICVWESFKAALWAGDIDKAVSFISEISRDKYSSIFNTIESHLQDYVSGMGKMILSSSKPREMRYGLLHKEGSQAYLFPVDFVKEDDGNWRMFNF